MDAKAIFGPAQAEKLLQQAPTFHSNGGYVVVDDFFAPAVAATFRDELVKLRGSGKMRPNCVQFNHRGTSTTVQKPYIHEADLFDDAAFTSSDLPAFHCFYRTGGAALAQSLSSAGYAGGLSCALSGRVVKLQYNDGHGGCFPFHYDNPGLPNRRALTCLVYLNPGWREGDGGELQLQPFLAPAVTIAPMMNRLVVFASDKILHRVLRNHKPRLCFTLWIDGAEVNLQQASSLRLSAQDFEDLPALTKKLRSSPAQRLLARATYAELFEKSLVECMGAGDDLQVLLDQHFTHLDRVRKNAMLQKVVQVLRALRGS